MALSTTRLGMGALVAAVLCAPAQVMADTASMQAGAATISAGGGIALLTMPDVRFTNTYLLQAGTDPLIISHRDNEDFGDEIGGQLGASIAVPATGLRGNPKTLTLGGFWARIDNDDSAGCQTNGNVQCLWINIVDDPAAGNAINVNFPGQFAVISSDREIDHWGVSLQSEWARPLGAATTKGAAVQPYESRFGFGFDVRGIYQDLSLRANSTANGQLNGTYDESLDTTYYGLFASWGRDYRLPLFSGLASGLGIQSSFKLRGGIYYADTDYDGRYQALIGGGDAGRLSLSSNDVAFIGGLVHETRKRIGARSVLSLTSEYEYYSWVPSMRYNNTDIDPGAGGVPFAGNHVGTSIGDDDAFSARTMLRLTVSLGGGEQAYK